MSRSLLKKLGIKESDQVYIHNAPDNYLYLLEEPLPPDVVLNESIPKKKLNLIHFFTNSISELERLLPIYQNLITQNGMIWVSWYKKSSKLPSEINEDIIRNTALALKLVDVKVCSVSDQWSALKLVIRVTLRQ